VTWNQGFIAARLAAQGDERSNDMDALFSTARGLFRTLAAMLGKGGREVFAVLTAATL
jgi:hypothetical protein